MRPARLLLTDTAADRGLDQAQATDVHRPPRLSDAARTASSKPGHPAAAAASWCTDVCRMLGACPKRVREGMVRGHWPMGVCCLPSPLATALPYNASWTLWRAGHPVSLPANHLQTCQLHGSLRRPPFPALRPPQARPNLAEQAQVPLQHAMPAYMQCRTAWCCGSPVQHQQDSVPTGNTSVTVHQCLSVSQTSDFVGDMNVRT